MCPVYGVIKSGGLKKCPQVRHYLLCAQYTNEKLKAQAGGPCAPFVPRGLSYHLLLQEAWPCQPT